MSTSPQDIRAYKHELRDKYKLLREKMTATERTRKDSAILKNLLSSAQYKGCKTLLCYVSTPREVDTHALITKALEDGKRVAVPYCIEGTRNMDFYLITGLDELVRRTFGVLEPDPSRAEKLTDFAGSICILPGLAFDYYGYRLGYGGGYYDRFLSGVYHGITMGVCYQGCTLPQLRHGRFDVASRMIVTERRVYTAKSRKNPRRSEGKSLWSISSSRKQG